MPEIFLDITVKVSNIFLARIISDDHPRDEFFTNLSQETGVLPSFSIDSNVWNLNGNWESVTKAYSLLSSIHDGDVYSATARVVPSHDWTSHVHVPSSRWLCKSRAVDTSGTQDATGPHQGSECLNREYSKIKNDPAIDEEDQSSQHSRLKLKDKEELEIQEDGHRNNDTDHSDSEKDKSRRELMIDKPLFSVDEIIKNIEKSSPSKNKGSTVHSSASELDNTDKNNIEKSKVDSSSHREKGVQSFNKTNSSGKHLSEEIQKSSKHLKDKTVLQSKQILFSQLRNKYRKEDQRTPTKLHKRKSKPKKFTEIHSRTLQGAQTKRDSKQKTHSPPKRKLAKKNTPIQTAITKEGATKDSQLCPECSKVFSSLSNLYRHMKVEHQGLRYNCEHCDKRFTCNDSLQRHIRIVHENLRCKDCFVIHNSQEELEKHECAGMKTTESVTCHECGKTYSCNSNLNKHIRVAHKGLSYLCELCEKTYRSKESLNEHQRAVHRLFRCHNLMCNAIFDNEESYAEHTINVHDGTQDAEDRRQLMKEKLVTKVIRKRAPATCDLCDKTFSSVSNLGKHMKVVHEKIRHHCDKCPRAFTCKEQLKRHYRVVHEGMTYPCCFCAEKFANRNSLAKHQQIVHKQLSIDSSFQCEICGKAFLYDCNLTRHRKRDHEGLRFECQVCHKEFKSKQRLQEHEKVEHEGHRYLCEQCPKEFRNKHKLKEHVISVHTTLKPHRCQHCNSSFARRSALTYHLQKVHGLPPNEPIPPEPIREVGMADTSTRQLDTVPLASTTGSLYSDEPMYTISNPTVLIGTTPETTSVPAEKDQEKESSSGVCTSSASESLLIPQVQVSGLLPSHVTSLPQGVVGYPQTLISQGQAAPTLSHPQLGIADLDQQNAGQTPVIGTMASHDPNIYSLQQQGQDQQQQSIFIPQHMLQQLQPGTLTPFDSGQQVQLSTMATQTTTQSFLSHGGMQAGSLTNVDINNALSQTLSHFAQAQFILPTDNTTFFNNAQHQNTGLTTTVNVDITHKNQN